MTLTDCDSESSNPLDDPLDDVDTLYAHLRELCDSFENCALLMGAKSEEKASKVRAVVEVLKLTLDNKAQYTDPGFQDRLAKIIDEAYQEGKKEIGCEE